MEVSDGLSSHTVSYEMDSILIVPASRYTIWIAKHLTVENFTKSSRLVEDLIWVFLVKMLRTINRLSQWCTEFLISQTVVHPDLIDTHQLLV